MRHRLAPSSHLPIDCSFTSGMNRVCVHLLVPVHPATDAGRPLNMGKQIFVAFIITAVILGAGVLALRNLPTQPTANPESAPSKQPYLVRPAEDQIHHNLSGVGDKPQETPAPSGETELAVPANPLLAERVTLALEAMDRKAYDKAGDLLKQAMAGTTDPDERIRLGQMLYECLIRTHDYQEALILGRDLLTLNPTPDEQLLITQQLAALLYRIGQNPEAEKILLKTIADEKYKPEREQLKAQLRRFLLYTKGRNKEIQTNFYGNSYLQHHFSIQITFRNLIKHPKRV